MENQTYPKASLLDWRCSSCDQGKPESGGYRVRKHRDIDGVREEKVLRVRCHRCKRSLGCVYPAGVKRYGWYSRKVEGLFAVLSVHQVAEGCVAEIAEHLAYPLKPATRAAWRGTRALRAALLEAKEPVAKEGVAMSIDEFKLGYWWMYTLTDVASQVIVDYALCESRDEEVLRELIARHDPALIISDGCSSVQAACAYFADKPHGRCWFHVIKDVLKQFPKNERALVALDLRFLYRCAKLEDARWFLRVLSTRYAHARLEPLLNAWAQLELYWQYEAMPLTNNVSETLYSALWSRSRKRVVKASHSALDWFKEARFRWHHHLVRAISPWQRFSGRPSKPWLKTLLTPLSYSTDF